MRRLLLGALPFAVLRPCSRCAPGIPCRCSSSVGSPSTSTSAWPARLRPGHAGQIVDIDDASLARIGQWPWPRTQLAELLERLTQAGAAAIAFDMVFAERDRSSPEQVLKQWAPTLEMAALRDSRPSAVARQHARGCHRRARVVIVCPDA